MGKIGRFAVAIAFIVTVTLDAQEQKPVVSSSDLVVHEWGVIPMAYGIETGPMSLAMPENDLPDFVQTAESRPKRAAISIDKPILYFYSTKELTVDIKVKFNGGMPHCWWPGEDIIFGEGGLGTFAEDVILSNPEKISWSKVRITPSAYTPWKEVKADSWWAVARETDSFYVTNRDNETERFIFYDGKTDYVPPLRIKNNENTLEIEHAGETPVYDLLIIDNKGEGDWFATMFKRLDPTGGSSRVAVTLQHSEGKTPTADDTWKAWRKTLEDAGLYQKEADGMARIWREQFFTKPGRRVIYRMARETYDAKVDLSITPKPKELVRVCLVALELQSDPLVKNVMAIVRKFEDDNWEVREAAGKELKKIGMIAAPTLRKILISTNDPEVRARLSDILKSFEPRERDKKK